MRIIFNTVCLLVVFVFSTNINAVTYEYTGGINSSVKIDDNEFCIRLDLKSPTVMKVLPMKIGKKELEIDSPHGLSRIDVCNLGLLYSEKNRSFFDKNSEEVEIDNINDMFDRGEDFDLYLAKILSRFEEPNCSLKSIYENYIEYIKYYTNTIECSDSEENTVNVLPVKTIKISTLFDRVETMEFTDLETITTIVGGIVIIGGVYFLCKNPGVGAQLSRLTNRLSIYLPRFGSGIFEKYGNGLTIRMALKTSLQKTFSTNTLVKGIKWSFNTAATGVVLYVVGSYLFSYGNTAINNSIDLSVPYKEVHEIPAYEIIPRNNHLYVTDMFVSQLHSGAFYAQNNSYGSARSAFIQAARTAIMYNEEVFRKTFKDMVKVIPGLNFEFSENVVDIKYNIWGGLDIDITVTKTGVNMFEAVDYNKDDEILILR
jgi:hypothetical protein